MFAFRTERCVSRDAIILRWLSGESADGLYARTGSRERATGHRAVHGISRGEDLQAGQIGVRRDMGAPEI